MVNNLKNKLFEQGYLKVKNVLNFQRDLKPILNDMEFVMDCLIQKFAKKKDVKKVLNLDFKKKYSYICLLYTSPSPRDVEESRMPSSA